MKVLALALVLLAVVQVRTVVGQNRGPGGPGGQPPVFDCTGKVGYFADLWRSCEVYYHCMEDGTKLTYGCPYQPEQYYFDESRIQCVSGEHFTCPEPEPV